MYWTTSTTKGHDVDRFDRNFLHHTLILLAHAVLWWSILTPVHSFGIPGAYKQSLFQTFTLQVTLLPLPFLTKQVLQT